MAASALPSGITRGLPPAAQAMLRSGAASRPTFALPGGTTRAGTRAASSGVAAINPSLRARYPADARQLFDAARGLFRVLIPLAPGLSGMTEAEAMRSPYRAGFAGGRAWGLGEDDDDADELGDYDATLARRKAPAAIEAVKRRARAGTLATPDDAIRAFQRVAGGAPALRADGLYGANTRRALVYYVPSSDASLPPRSGGTWRAPGSAPPRTTSSSPTSSPPTPPGYAEAGTETENPGLPPVGAPTSSTATQAPPEPAGAPQPPPDAAAPGAPPPAFSTPEAEERAFALTPPQPPPPPEIWQTSTPPAPAPPQQPQTVTYYGPGTSTSSSDDGNTFLWLALFYYYTRSKR
jgi:hypothetical protein